MDYRRNEEKAMLEQFQEWVDFYDLILHNICHGIEIFRDEISLPELCNSHQVCHSVQEPSVWHSTRCSSLSPGSEVFQVLSAPKSPSYGS